MALRMYQRFDFRSPLSVDACIQRLQDAQPLIDTTQTVCVWKLTKSPLSSSGVYRTSRITTDMTVSRGNAMRFRIIAHSSLALFTLGSKNSRDEQYRLRFPVYTMSGSITSEDGTGATIVHGATRVSSFFYVQQAVIMLLLMPVMSIAQAVRAVAQGLPMTGCWWLIATCSMLLLLTILCSAPIIGRPDNWGIVVFFVPALLLVLPNLGDIRRAANDIEQMVKCIGETVHAVDCVSSMPN